MWQTHQIIGTQEEGKDITVGATAVLPYRGPPTAGLQSPVCLHRTSGSASGQPPTDKTTTWISSFLPRTAWSGCSEYSTNKEHLMKTQLKTMSCLAECSRTQTHGHDLSIKLVTKRQSCSEICPSTAKWTIGICSTLNVSCVRPLQEPALQDFTLRRVLGRKMK